MAYDESGRWIDDAPGEISTVRPVPADWPGGPAGWANYEERRLRDAGLPSGPSGRALGEPAGRLGRSLQEAFASTGRGRDLAGDLGRPPTVLESLFGLSAGSVPVDTGRTPVTTDSWERGGIPPSSPVTPPSALPDLSGIFTDAGPTGYSPSLVDTSAAESLLRYEQTPEEQAALDQLLQDLDFRAEAGTTAVRTGWQDVQRINSAAADKAAQMAREAGPEAARLWIDAANTVLTLSAQAADVLGSTAGMQRVNVSPTAGSGRIAALLAAEAPRAQALAERMGLATSEQIASQARTAGMMGEAYAGEIQRTSLIQANKARQAHNTQVFDRISEERQLGAEMRFNAAQTNAQLLSAAAAAAVSGATSEEQRRGQIRNLISDVREFANIDPQDADPSNGIAALMGVYGLDVDTARGLIMGAREGTLNWAALMAEIEG